jgi:hypothetical protein
MKKLFVHETCWYRYTTNGYVTDIKDNVIREVLLYKNYNKCAGGAKFFKKLSTGTYGILYDPSKEK